MDGDAGVRTLIAAIAVLAAALAVGLIPADAQEYDRVEGSFCEYQVIDPVTQTLLERGPCE